MSPVVTFFWCHMNVMNVRQLKQRGLPLPLRTVKVKTPQTFIFDSEGPLLITIRGTDVSVPKNIVVDFLGRLPRTILKAKARDKLRSATLDVRTLIEEKLDSMKSTNGGVSVHAGLFLYALRCLVHTVKTLRRMPKRSIHVYGHSLGAACGSFLYTWLSELGYDVTCSCLSCPRLCNDAGYDLWFARHDVPSRYRHYYTRGDPVIHAIPRTAGLTRHVSMTYYVAPLVKLRGAGRLVSRIMAHVTFQPGRFKRVIKSLNKSRSRLHKQTPAKGRSLAGHACFSDRDTVLCPQAYEWALRT